MAVEQMSWYAAEYQNIAEHLPGGTLSWLQALRRQAFEHFSAHGFPSLREEEWRYTNVSAIEKKRFSAQFEPETADVEPQIIQACRVEDAYSVVLLNGRFNPQLSDLEGLPEQVSVLSMAEALRQQPELIEAYFSKAVAIEEHGFVAFNSAWFSDGLFVHIPKKQVLEKPIQYIHVVTQADLLATTRNLIIAEEMAEVKIIESYIGIDDAYLTAAVTEIFVENNAELTCYKIQSEGEKAYHFGGTYVSQARDSRFKHHNFAFGSLLARSDIHTNLGLASECELNGLFLGMKRQHIDNHTRINHQQSDASSRELYKGILNQRARGVFQGRVLVAEDAQKTDSEMNNRNLLLSPDAEVDTKPQLEIYADDVKCAHGVTVGQLDEKSIFYLQTRGIDEQAAKNMLTFAFANDMVDRIKLKSLRELVLAQLLKSFPQASINAEWL